jgi:hypothetical protein
MPKRKALTLVRKRRFVLEYVKDYNATQAAIRMGIPPSGARTQAWRLLKDVDVRAELEKHQAQTKRDYSLTYDKIVRDVIDVGDAAFSAHNYPTALKAKVLVGRHIGMWSNRPKLPRASEQTPVTANPVILRLEEMLANIVPSTRLPR